ncbi:unnamed protein product [Mytilus edulis]|uniref:Ig-like domain-containing protein n=1 Tax=Mytilus edulis TaxID=6550 RepID=A0A8S3Q8Z9_MYTED|nr:unnamed protein product [Mytilus edulis]
MNYCVVLGMTSITILANGNVLNKTVEIMGIVLSTKKGEPLCRCSEIGDFVLSGPNCEIQREKLALESKYIIAITATVGTVLSIVIMITCFLYYQTRRKVKSMTKAIEVVGDVEDMSQFRPSSIRGSFYTPADMYASVYKSPDKESTHQKEFNNSNDCTNKIYTNTDYMITEGEVLMSPWYQSTEIFNGKEVTSYQIIWLNLIIDPPTVELVVTEDFIECVLQPGIPASIILFHLEYQSAVGVHIRGNQSLLSDQLLLQKSYIPYETNGIYVCKVSNGVADIHGFAIHNKSTIFKYSGIDHDHQCFSNENTNAVFGELGQPCLIKFMIYSFPILKELRLQKKFSNHSTIHNVESYQIIESSLSYTEHDTEETIQGYEIIYETNLLTNEDFTVLQHMCCTLACAICIVSFDPQNQKGLAIIQQEHSYDEINVVSYELDGIHQPEDEVNEQSLDGNFVDNDVYRPNVTDDSANLMVHIAQTSPTDTHRNDYENMYQPIVRERHDSHYYSQCVSDGFGLDFDNTPYSHKHATGSFRSLRFFMKHQPYC